MLLAMERTRGEVQVFNLGTDEYCRGERLDRLDLRNGSASRPRSNSPAATAAGSATTRSSFSTARKIRALGWTPKLTIREGVFRTLDYLRANPQLLEARA